MKSEKIGFSPLTTKNDGSYSGKEIITFRAGILIAILFSITKT